MSALDPGSTFAGYRIEGVAGHGGMGVVYRATDLALSRPVALKLIAPELARDERFRRRFLDEPRLAAALDHPNVVPIYEAGEHDGRLYLAMRFVRGSDLGALLAREGTLEPRRALALLGQVADALDAAHRRGLVHRDVKPGNVLVDEDDHAYLTDFGVSKQAGGTATDSGQMVGTLDYLAPEQIRGEPASARSDGYALACVLYQCVAGIAPFRRDSEATTLWAHLHDEPAALARAPTLDPVLRRGLAKDPQERFETCTALIAEAARALAGGRAPHRGRRRLLVAMGVAVLLATAAVAALPRGHAHSSGAVRVANGVIGLGDSRSFTKLPSPPSNIAAGEGAVWVLSTDDPAITRLDPATGRVEKRFETGSLPSDIAAGEGAVWVGNGGDKDSNATVSVSRVDPRTAKVTRTVRLPGSGGWPSVGSPGIVVGDGGVWAIAPDDTIVRLDPRTGALVARIHVSASGIAAGDAGVWFVNGDDDAVARIDPRTNRPGKLIRPGASLLDGIAVGAGSVWVAGPHDGLVWRIQPGRRPVVHTIEVGLGVTFAAFGQGALWTANIVDGTVARIDPRTNAVAKRYAVGGILALGAGPHTTWVSVPGGSGGGDLPVSACDRPVSGGDAAPDVLIASEMPLQGFLSAASRPIADAVRAVVQERGFRAGRFTVGYQSCDASTAQSGVFDRRRCAANANAFARTKRLLAVIGPYSSFCADVEIPILDRAPGGAVALISPMSTDQGLTRKGYSPPNGYPDEPDVWYPAGTRNFLRVAPRDDLHGLALAKLAAQMRLKRVYVLRNRSTMDDSVGKPFLAAAPGLGVRIAGTSRVRAGAAGRAEAVRRVAASGADAVVIATYEDPRLLRALRGRVGPRVPLLAGYLWTDVGAMPAARGLYVATWDVPVPKADLRPAARRFVRRLGEYSSGVVEAAQATQLTLDAIARSDGTRPSVLRELRATRVTDGLLDDFHFDRYGDTTRATVKIVRYTGRPGPALVLRAFRGAVVDRAIAVP